MTSQTQVDRLTVAAQTASQLTMKPLTLYLRREPTTDYNLRHYSSARIYRDVVAYADREATQPKARWPWHYASIPRRNRKTVMVNCYKWRVVWLPDLGAE